MVFIWNRKAEQAATEESDVLLFTLGPKVRCGGIFVGIEKCSKIETEEYNLAAPRAKTQQQGKLTILI